MLDQIRKGTAIHVWGRFRSSKFEGQDGTEKQFYELLATKLRIETEETD
jgi:single-stranded DNA-binding protein